MLIQYKAKWNEDDDTLHTVAARSINSGARKALVQALRSDGPDGMKQFHSIEFWQVVKP